MEVSPGADSPLAAKVSLAARLFVRTAAGRMPKLGALLRLLGFVSLVVVLTILVLQVTPEGILGQGMGMLLVALVVSALLMSADGHSLASLGIPFNAGALRNFALGILVGIVPALVVLGFAMAFGGIRYQGASGSLLEYLSTGGWTLVVLAFPAAAEEVLFRGYPMRVLMEGFGTGFALVATSTLFAFIHMGNPEVGSFAIANIAIAGVFLGVVYLKTGSLWWATGAHLGWNFATGFLADLPVSGLRIVDAPLLEATSTGNPLLTGGAFGLEGGVLTTGVLLLGTAVLARTNLLRPSPAALAEGSVAPMGNRPPPFLLKYAEPSKTAETTNHREGKRNELY